MAYSELIDYYCHNKMCGHIFKITVFNGQRHGKTACPECGYLTGKLSPMLTEEELTRIKKELVKITGEAH